MFFEANQPPAGNGAAIRLISAGTICSWVIAASDAKNDRKGVAIHDTGNAADRFYLSRNGIEEED